MQATLPAPINVTVSLPEHPFYAQWDFWLAAITLVLAGTTAWLALETRQMRIGSDRAMGELVKRAEEAGTASKRSADAAQEGLRLAGAQGEALKRNAGAMELLSEAIKRIADAYQLRGM